MTILRYGISNLDSGVHGRTLVDTMGHDYPIITARRDNRHCGGRVESQVGWEYGDREYGDRSTIPRSCGDPNKNVKQARRAASPRHSSHSGESACRSRLLKARQRRPAKPATALSSLDRQALIGCGIDGAVWPGGRFFNPSPLAGEGGAPSVASGRMRAYEPIRIVLNRP